jgi:hypothetical protein
VVALCLDPCMAHLTCLTPAYRTCLSDFPAFLHHCNRCVRIIAVHPPTTGLLMTAGWDSTLRYWDLRLPPPSSCVATAALPGRAYTLSASTTHMVVGTSERHVLIYHTRRWAPQVASDTCDGTHAMQQWVIARHLAQGEHCRPAHQQMDSQCRLPVW